MRQRRSSNFELLRIVVMLMIIAYHYVIHGQVGLLENGNFLQRIFLECFSMFGKIGVNLFVLISGYFGLEKCFSVKKLLKLEVQCLFFSLLGVVIGIGLELELPSKEVIKMFFPITSNQYWYMTAYVILYLLSPWYNEFLKRLDRKQYNKLLLMMTLIWGIIPCVTLQTTTGMNFTQQIWMFVVYAYGGYYARFGSKIRKKKQLLAVFMVVLLGSVVALEILGMKWKIFSDCATYFRWSNTIVAFPLTLLIFIIFRELNFKNTIVNKISGAAFSVYLFHENPVISKILWPVLCGDWNGGLLVFGSTVIVLIIFGFGWLIHQLYQFVDYLLDKPMTQMAGMISDFAEKIMK